MAHMAIDAPILLEGHILEGQTLSKQGHEVLVTVIAGGQSKNGFVYDEATLQQLARMLEGAQAYADHDVTAPVRSVRDMVGFYTNAVYSPPDSTTPFGHVAATLHILEAAEWLWSIIYEAVSIGKPDLVGLSVDIFGTWTQDGGTAAKQVTGIRSINSCDVVTRPSAGGSFQRILHSHSTVVQQEQGYIADQLSEASRESGVVGRNRKGDLFMEPTTPTVSPTSPGASSIPHSEGDQADHPTGSAQHILEQQPQVQQPPQESQMQTLLHQLQVERAQLQLERRLLESVLPQAVTAPLRERYTGRVFEMAELERDLTASQQMMANLASQGIVRDNGYEKPLLGQQITEAEKVQAAFDLMFEDGPGGKLTLDSRFVGIRAFGSIREAYARATGDPSVSGSGTTNLGLSRVSEHAPVGRIPARHLNE